jgi:hypothetical protein
VFSRGYMQHCNLTKDIRIFKILVIFIVKRSPWKLTFVKVNLN